MTHLWWQKGIVYQVYPRSFADSNGDGIGDLRGVIQKLPYLEQLGVDAIWISPVYPSPMADFGYDVSDYTGVHPIFGTLQDLEELIERTHQRGMKIILDFVPNHTSHQHPWFLEARSSRDNPKRDYYLWHDARHGGGAPNNWLSVFGGSAWEWEPKTEQYYLHSFLKEQPDLNWRNPEVRREMYAAMRFWLERGVDGFRVDVLWHLIKDAEWRDNPPNPDYRPDQVPYNALLPTYSTDQPEVHEIAGEMRALLDRYPERVLIGEIYLPIRRLMAYYGTSSPGAHLPFNFQLITLPWNAQQISAAVSEYEGSLPANAWPNWVLGNHDQARIASRVGLAQARVAAVLLLTLRGTPTLYYGDELGMRDAMIFPEDMQDPQGKQIGVSRDPARTPMQWDPSLHAGFSRAVPWLPVGYDYQHCNVECQAHDKFSMLTLYQRLIELRRKEPALSVGSYKPVLARGQLMAYLREAGDQRFLVVLNLGSRPDHLSLEDVGEGQIVINTDPRREGEQVGRRIVMLGDDAAVVRLRPVENVR